MSLPSVRVNALTAAQVRKRLLMEIVCSEYWMDQVVIPADERDGQSDVWLICQDVYPPHDNGQSLMLVCPGCNHICPPDMATGKLCCDCQAEQELDAIAELVADPANHELAFDLLRLSRLPTISYSRFKQTHDIDDLGVFVEAPDDDDAQWAGPDSGTRSDNATHSDAKPPYRHFASAREMAKPLRNFLSKRAGGCVPLLPEKESDLQEEIAYFEANGTIMPRASKAFFRVSMRR